MAFTFLDWPLRAFWVFGGVFTGRRQFDCIKLSATDIELQVTKSGSRWGEASFGPTALVKVNDIKRLDSFKR